MSKTAIRNFAFGLLVATMILAPPSFLPFDFSTNENNHTENETESADVSSNNQETNEGSEQEQALQEEIASLEDELAVSKEVQDDLQNELEESATNEEDETGEEETVRLYLSVSDGMTASEIAGILEDSEIIDDRSEFNTYMEDNEMIMDVRSGRYELTDDMSIPEVAETITS